MADRLVFLNARYDERERTALAARRAVDKARTTGTTQSTVWTIEPWQPSEPGALPGATWVVTGPDGEEGVAMVNGSYAADHIVLNDPAAALKDIAMKRAILAEHQPRTERDGWDTQSTICGTCRFDEGLDAYGYPCPTVRLLLSEFDTHPDYEKGWKP